MNQVTKQQKIDWLKNNYDISNINPYHVSFNQLIDIENVMIKSGFYKRNIIEQGTLINLIFEACGVKQIKNKVFHRKKEKSP